MEKGIFDSIPVNKVDANTKKAVSGAELQSYCQTIVGSGKARYTYYITGQASHIDTGGME